MRAGPADEGYCAKRTLDLTKEPVEERAEDARKVHEQKLEELGRDRELNEAMAEVAQSVQTRREAEAKADPEPHENGRKRKSEHEKARERVTQRVDQMMGSRRAVYESRQALKDRYADDPEMLEEIDDIFDAIREEESTR